MEKIKIWLNKYKYSIIVAVLTFLVLTVRDCVGRKQNRLEGSAKELKEQLKVIKADVKLAEETRLKTKDSVNKVIKNLTEKTLKSEIRVVYLQKKNKEDKERIAKLTYVQSAEELNKEYGTDLAVATDKSVELNGDLPNKVLQTISDNNTCQEVILEKDSQLANKDEQIKGLDLVVFSAEKELEQRKKESELADRLNNNLNKQIKTLKTKNFLNQYVMPVIYVGGGFLIGRQIVK